MNIEITKQDVLAGQKTFDVETIWGDLVPVTIHKIPRRHLQQIIANHPQDADDVLARACTIPSAPEPPSAQIHSYRTSLSSPACQLPAPEPPSAPIPAPEAPASDPIDAFLQTLSVDGWTTLLTAIQALNLGVNHVKKAQAAAAQMMAPVAATISPSTAPSVS